MTARLDTLVANLACHSMDRRSTAPRYGFRTGRMVADTVGPGVVGWWRV